MQYIIYCDESEKNGKFYGNFYGGALVRSTDFDKVKNELEKRKNELGLTGEVKWQKVTENYLEKYISLIDCFFDFVKQDKVKIRIMFTHNLYIATGLTKEQKDNEYFLLYYQFFKNAFGFRYSNPGTEPISLYIFFDQLPDTKEKNQKFIDYIYNLQYQPEFKEAKLFFHKKDDIAEAISHKHVILQCLDIVLGSMEFRLNEKHKVVPEGQRIRGKRTRAKEKLYNHINQRIREIYPGFNIGVSTGLQGDHTNLWKHPYRHWKFLPYSSKLNEQYISKNKR